DENNIITNNNSYNNNNNNNNNNSNINNDTTTNNNNTKNVRRDVIKYDENYKKFPFSGSRSNFYSNKNNNINNDIAITTTNNNNVDNNNSNNNNYYNNNNDNFHNNDPCYKTASTGNGINKFKDNLPNPSNNNNNDNNNNDNNNNNNIKNNNNNIIDYRIQGVIQKATFLIISAFFIFYCYARIYILVRLGGKRLATLSGTYCSKNNSLRIKRELTIFKTVVAVFIFFVANYLPVSLIHGLDTNKNVPYSVYVMSVMLLWTSSALNWVVYGMMNAQYSKAYRFVLLRSRLLNYGSGCSGSESYYFFNYSTATKSRMTSLSYLSAHSNAALRNSKHFRLRHRTASDVITTSGMKRNDFKMSRLTQNESA
ncbi:hypothetical protein HELRODRAFT_184743, partial [Helobdella robusta]|uniref:G-protein coupled receptors family 1 profile domain-containing protein n=1 Tax=Helobdella robusta TaxID=6412 RepID=T1FLW9_HELRO